MKWILYSLSFKKRKQCVLRARGTTQTNGKESKFTKECGKISTVM